MTVQKIHFQARWDDTNKHLETVPPGALSLRVRIQNLVYSLFTITPIITGMIANRALLPPVALVHLTLSKKKFETFWFGPITEENRKIREHFTVETKSIATPDGAVLHVFWVRHKEATPESSTIVYFNGRAQLATAERNRWLLEQSIEHGIPYNFVFFDYRGIGESTGTFRAAKDLVIDGSTVIQWVREHLHVPADQIHFYGYSLGGAVSVATKALDAEHLTGRLVNERSFATFEKVIQSWFRFLGRGSTLLAKMVYSQGYRLDVDVPWKILQGKKLVVYHPKDPIIPASAGLYQIVSGDEVLLLEAKPEHQILTRFLPHNAPLDWFSTAGRITDFLFGMPEVLHVPVIELA
jgi:hypothetical protein